MNALTFEVLLTLAEKTRDSEGILRGLAEIEEGSSPPALASFYRCLKRAVESRFVEVLSPVDSERPGRPRQIYRLTDVGRKALLGEARRLHGLSRRALSAASPNLESES